MRETVEQYEALAREHLERAEGKPYGGEAERERHGKLGVAFANLALAVASEGLREANAAAAAANLAVAAANLAVASEMEKLRAATEANTTAVYAVAPVAV